MKNTTTKMPRSDTIQRQHEKLQSMLSRSQELVGRDHLNPVEVWNCFNDLSKAVDIHFLTEEAACGLFDRLMADAPQFAKRISELLREHGTLRHMMLDLARAATLLRATNQLPPQLIQAFSEFHDKFRQHEMKEDELLEDVYSSDQGAID